MIKHYIIEIEQQLNEYAISHSTNIAAILKQIEKCKLKSILLDKMK